MNENEAIKAAHQTAENNGWPWLEPIQILKKRPWFRSPYWEVITNNHQRGCNIHLQIDDDTGEIIKAAFYKR